MGEIFFYITLLHVLHFIIKYNHLLYNKYLYVTWSYFTLFMLYLCDVFYYVIPLKTCPFLCVA